MHGSVDSRPAEESLRSFLCKQLLWTTQIQRPAIPSRPPLTAESVGGGWSCPGGPLLPRHWTRGRSEISGALPAGRGAAVWQAGVQVAPLVEAAAVGPQVAQQTPAAGAQRQTMLADPQMRDPVLQLLLLSEPMVWT